MVSYKHIYFHHSSGKKVEKSIKKLWDNLCQQVNFDKAEEASKNRTLESFCQRVHRNIMEDILGQLKIGQTVEVDTLDFAPIPYYDTGTEKAVIMFI
jgi:hypothetical protein